MRRARLTSTGAGCRWTHRGFRRASALLLVAGIAAVATPARAQSLLERPPNMSGGWVGTPGTLYFNFLHRFTTSDAPARKVSNSPTFLVAGGLPWRMLVGFNYATNSDVVASFPNEWEPFVRWAPLAQDAGRIADLGLQGGYNAAARSADGELSLARRFGALQLHGAARFLSNAYDLGSARTALAGGAVVRLGRFAALAGDWSTLLDRPDGFEPAWSAGLHVAIPYTPHTLSLQVTNTSTATLQGLSAARSTERRYGFEFTIPLTLRRYFHRATPPMVASVAATDSAAHAQATSSPDTTVGDGAARDTARGAAVEPKPGATAADSAARAVPLAAASASAATAANAANTPAKPKPTSHPAPHATRASMRQLTFSPARIEVAAGGTITWTNRDAMVHTVTDAAGKWDSGLIEPGRTWSRRFDKPGTYNIRCTPHPFMKAVIVVRPAEAP